MCGRTARSLTEQAATAVRAIIDHAYPAMSSREIPQTVGPSSSGAEEVKR